MQTVSVRTAQNVDIEYPVAGVGERMLAVMVDYIVIGVYFFLLVFLYAYFEKSLKPHAVVYFILAGLPVITYDFLCETAFNGQSFGKMALRIRVVRIDGTQPSVGSYLIRWLLRLVDITLSSGAVAVITILINGKGQRVGDIAAGTAVIRLKSAVTIRDTILVPLDENYRPAFAEAKNLGERPVTIIKEALDFHKKNRRARAAEEVLTRAKGMLEEKMGMKSAMEPKEFLETVLKDYNYYNGKT